ncbi:unnamed protein product, partial [Rotaria sordida]
MVTYSSATLVDGIVTISWDQNEQVPIIDRFLTGDTQIQLKILCRESSLNTSVTRELIKKKLYKLNEKVTDTNIIIRGRIGRVVGCLPMQSDPFISTTQEDKNTEKKLLQIYYDLMWKEMEQMTFTAKQSDCDYSGTHLVIEQYSDIKKPEISPQQAIKLRSQQANINKNKRNRRATNDISSPLANSVRLSTGTLLTWADGFYLIEIYRPEIIGSYSSELDIDV